MAQAKLIIFSLSLLATFALIQLAEAGRSRSKGSRQKPAPAPKVCSTDQKTQNCTTLCQESNWNLADCSDNGSSYICTCSGLTRKTKEDKRARRPSTRARCSKSQREKCNSLCADNTSWPSHCIQQPTSFYYCGCW